jgi:hypothetical protein
MIIKLGEKRSDLLELVDAIEECKSKLGFIAEFFTSGKPGFNFEISERGTFGIYCILREVEDELGEVEDELGLVAKELEYRIKKDPETAKKRAASDLNNLTKE